MSNSAFASPVDYATFPWDRPKFYRANEKFSRHVIWKLLLYSFFATQVVSSNLQWLLVLIIPWILFYLFHLLYPFWFQGKWSRKFHESGRASTVEFEISSVVPTTKIRRSQAFELANHAIALLLFTTVLGYPQVPGFSENNGSWKYLVALFPLGMSAISIRGILQKQRLLRHPQPDQLLVLQQGLLWESSDTGWFYPWSMIESASWRQGHESETLLLKTRYNPNCNSHYEHVETRGVTPADRERLLKLIDQHSDSSSSTEEN